MLVGSIWIQDNELEEVQLETMVLAVADAATCLFDRWFLPEVATAQVVAGQFGQTLEDERLENLMQKVRKQRMWREIADYRNFQERG